MNSVEIIKDGTNTTAFADKVKTEFCGNDSIVRIINPLSIERLTIKLGDNCQFICSDGLKIIQNLFVDIRANKSKVIIGENFTCGQLGIQCFEESGLTLTIGKDCLFGWDVNIRMGDGHTIYDVATKAPLNIPSGITIGNHVWVGRSVILLKNVTIGDNSVVGIRSLVTSRFNESNVIIAGIPAKIVKRGINWDFLHTEAYSRKLIKNQENKA